MSTPQRDLASLWDMLTATRHIQAFTRHLTQTDFLDNLLVQNAVERQLEILGEAAQQVSTKLQACNPKIPWRDIIGLRNILAHRYDDIDAQRIWRVATHEIQELRQLLENLLPANTDDTSNPSPSPPPQP